MMLGCTIRNSGHCNMRGSGIPNFTSVVTAIWDHKVPPPKFNMFAPEKWCLEDKPFLLGFGNFSGANC